MRVAIERLGSEKVLELVKHYVQEHHIPAELGLDVVCRACIMNLQLTPRRIQSNLSDEEAVLRWCKRFWDDYKARPSVRVGKPPHTRVDEAVGVILHAALPTLSASELECVEYAHRLAMSAENLLGPFVEEYVFERLKEFGWAMAWGKTLRAVDLCNAEGVLIQLKNRSNTENSSSRQVREGTSIKKWFRVDAVTNEFHWRDLCELSKVPDDMLTEDDFRNYIKKALLTNPQSLGVDEKNPWSTR